MRIFVVIVLTIVGIVEFLIVLLYRAIIKELIELFEKKTGTPPAKEELEACAERAVSRMFR